MGRRQNRCASFSLALLLQLAAAVFAWAGIAQAESEVPGLPSSPPERFAVMPFENRSGVMGLEWMRLAVPFVLAERAEGFARLQPAYGPLVVEKPGRETGTSVAKVEAFAKSRSLRWVLTGWVRRPEWKLELGVSLYRINGRRAVLAAEASVVGEFKDIHELVGSCLNELAAQAKLVDVDDERERIGRISSADFYAFTLFGRALWTMLAVSEDAKAGQTMLRPVYIEPTFTEARRLWAYELARQRKPVIAMAQLETVLKARPRYGVALLAYARAARKRGQVRLATEYMERALRARRWDLEARYELGMLYWLQGQSDTAYKQLSIVARANPTHIRARRALALIHAKRSDTTNLVSELRAIAALAPKDTETQLELAAALVAADSIDSAIAVYKNVVELDARNIQALKFLGDLHRQVSQFPRAVRYYGLAIQAAPNDPRAYFLLGTLYVEMGQDAAARRIFMKAQRFPAWKGEAFNNLGAIALRSNRVAQGLWYLKRAVQKNGRRARYRYNLALALSKTHAAHEALDEIDLAIELAGDQSESHYLRGVVLLKLGRAEEARIAFRKTLSLWPEHSDAQHNLGVLDAMKQRIEEGVLAGESAP